MRRAVPLLLAAACALAMVGSVPVQATEGGLPCPAPTAPRTGPTSRSWSGRVTDDAPNATLDVRVRMGTVHVVAGPPDRYRVEAPANAEVDVRSNRSRFDLDVEASPVGSSGPLGLVGGAATVVVHVPDLVYDDVRIELDEPAGADPVHVAGVTARRLDVDTEGTAVILDGVASDDLRAASRRGGIRLADATGNASLETRSGPICVDAFDGQRLEADGTSGGIAARDVRAEDVRLETRGGDILGELTPRGTGDVTLVSRTGHVQLTVAVTADRALEVDLQTRAGTIRHDVPGTRVVEQDRDRVRLRTRDAADRPRGTDVRLETEQGDVSARGHGTLAQGQAPTSTGGDVPVEAGLFAALVAALVVAWPKCKALAWGLYSRIGRDDVLDHDVRRAIVDHVREEPGIHFRDLKRRTDLGTALLNHHLDALLRTDHLVEKTVDGYRCYFVRGEVGRQVMETAGRLRSASARDLLRAVDDRPGTTLTGLAEAAGIPSSTAAYHLDRLAEAGLVDKVRDGPGLAVRLTELGRRALAELGLA